jgi:predicted component of type VI protein secretion system
MEVQLKVLMGGNAGQILKVPGPKFFIGRAEDCHLRPGSDLVSRHHCVLMLEADSLVIRDFGSKNGTLLNDERVTVESELKHGDRLKVGPLEFEVQVLQTSKRPKVHSVAEAAVRTAESGIQKDLDIGDWLSGDAVDDTGDTREINRAGDTEELNVRSTKLMPTEARSAPPPPEPEPEPVAAALKPPAKTESKAPGKLPPTGKRPGDSHDAAAEMLKKLRRR